MLTTMCKIDSCITQGAQPALCDDLERWDGERDTQLKRKVIYV